MLSIFFLNPLKGTILSSTMCQEILLVGRCCWLISPKLSKIIALMKHYKKNFSDEAILKKNFLFLLWFSINQLKDLERKCLTYHRILVIFWFSPFLSLLSMSSKKYQGMARAVSIFWKWLNRKYWKTILEKRPWLSSVFQVWAA